MSTQEHKDLRMLASQFHLLICNKKASDCPKCKEALLARELLTKAGAV